jgi:hypothetical protein
MDALRQVVGRIQKWNLIMSDRSGGLGRMATHVLVGPLTRNWSETK